MNAADSVIGCVLVTNKGNIPSSFSNAVWPRFPHLSEIASSGLGLALLMLSSLLNYSGDIR